MFAGHLAVGGDLLEVSRAARAMPAPPRSPRPAGLLLDGLALLVTERPPPSRYCGRPPAPLPARTSQRKRYSAGAGWPGLPTKLCGTTKAGV